ncbi:MAG: EFR1 family ferrodoxin [Candidatus Omnitrophica bacterium]|nr:EFR1 family ferrodoxin [Candidatus Omnitrophota bacterium]MDD5488962.1 EFR1 family ferrodoxin [Candidatus Omnitrophota bacterium]
MRTILYYFTGTGNTLSITRKLAGLLGGAEMVFIPDVIREEGLVSPDADRVGIIFPVYMLAPPLIVRDLIKKLTLKEGAYVFAVCDHGGMAAGTLRIVSDLLAERGIRLSAGFTVRMPENYLPFRSRKGDKDLDGILSRSDKKVEEIAGMVATGKEARVEKSLSFLSSLTWKLFCPKTPTMDSEFRVRKGCTSCGVCEKVCPAGDIVMKDGRPEWQGRCYQCYACINWCPEGVIEAGKGTEGKGRYHHPGVKLEDVIRK